MFGLISIVNANNFRSMALSKKNYFNIEAADLFVIDFVVVYSKIYFLHHHLDNFIFQLFNRLRIIFDDKTLQKI